MIYFLFNLKLPFFSFLLILQPIIYLLFALIYIWSASKFILFPVVLIFFDNFSIFISNLFIYLFIGFYLLFYKAKNKKKYFQKTINFDILFIYILIKLKQIQTFFFFYFPYIPCFFIINKKNFFLNIIKIMYFILKKY
jgi:hypothetical protein